MANNIITICITVCMLSISCNNRQTKNNQQQLNAFINDGQNKYIFYDKRQLKNSTYIDSIINVENGVVYFANTGCSACIGQLISLIDNIAKTSDNTTIYIATQDTITLQYYISKLDYNNHVNGYIFIDSEKEVRFYNGLVLYYKEGEIKRFMRTPFHTYGRINK